MVLLSPKNWKHRKQHRGRLKGKALNGTRVSFGDFGLKAVSPGYLTSRQLESARKAIVRYTRDSGRIWFRVFPDIPYTKKGLEMPMGKGKGDVVEYVARIKPGRIVFEISGVSRTVAMEAFKQATYKLPVKTTLIERGEVK